MTSLVLLKSPVVKWAVWIPGMRRAESLINPSQIWWSFNRDSAEARAEFVNGKVVDLAWLLEHQDAMRRGEVIL